MKILIFHWNNVLTDLEKELRNLGHTILPLDGNMKTFNKADVIITWNEAPMGKWRDVIQGAVDKGKRVILVQHGRKGTSRIYPPFNEKLVSNVACVWGEADKKRLMSVGIPEDKIKVTGTTIFKHLKPRVPHEGYNVVFSPEHWDKEVGENFLVASELRKLYKKIRNVKIITKGLKDVQTDYRLYDNLIISDRNSPEHFEIVADVLSTADLVVSISESTFELFAQYLDIPVVIADCWIPKACNGDDRYKTYHREYSNAVAKVPIKKLNRTIKRHLKRPHLLKKERAEVVLGDGGTNIADPLSELVKVICNTKE